MDDAAMPAPCPNPWCDSHERDLPLTALGIAEAPILHGRIGFRIECSDCGLHSATVERKANVWSVWNARHVPSHPDTADVSDETIDRILRAFRNGLIDLPDDNNPLGYTTYYLPREAMRAAIAAMQGDVDHG